MDAHVAVAKIWRREEGSASLPQDGLPLNTKAWKVEKSGEGQESGPSSEKREWTISKVEGRGVAVSRGWFLALKAARK